MTEWSKQMQGEVTKLKSNISKFKKAILVGVPPAPWCKKSETTRSMRTQINNALKKVTRDNLNIKYIDVEQEEEEDESNWEDERHMTEKFSSYVMGKIADKMQEIKGELFYIPTIAWTSKRKYQQVKTTYKLGCEVCTTMGHSQGSCENKKKRNRSANGAEVPTGGKRDRH